LNWRWSDGLSTFTLVSLTFVGVALVGDRVLLISQIYDVVYFTPI